MFTARCSSTCKSFLFDCACGDSTPEWCFCMEVGNASPNCLQSSLSECGLVPSCSADLSNDPTNCGRCGHDCGSLQCVRGACQPEQGALVGSLTAVAADDNSLYVLACGGADGNVMRVPRSGVPDGGAPVVLASRTTDCPTGLAVDPSTLYWVTRYTVMRASLVDGGSPELLDSYGPTWSWTSSASHQHGVASDADFIYFAVGGSGSIYAYSKATGKRFTVASEGSAFQHDGLIGLSGGNLYFTTYGSAGEELRVVSKDGGVSTSLAPLASAPIDLLVLADGVYVSSDLGVLRVPLAGAPVETVVNRGAVLLASDGQTLYWTNPGAVPHIYLRPLAGGPIEMLPSAVTYNTGPDVLFVAGSSIGWNDTWAGHLEWMPLSYRP